MDRIFDDFALERTINERFGLNMEIESAIAYQIPVSATAIATVFLTSKKQLYCYIAAQSSLNWGDVKKMLSRMGLKPGAYVPPKGRPDYFEDIARDKFRKVFPGRSHITSDDLIYYRTLVPYNPALVQINEIPEGHIYQYDTDAHNNWRPAAKFTYRRIKTS